MKKLTVTVKGLVQYNGDTAVASAVNFTIYNGDNELISDAIIGKSQSPYSRQYAVGDIDGDLKVVHNRPDLRDLEVSAALS
ncbi:hypothetical protein NMD73_03740 [Edwardsiella tarda]|uniref:hypothetical protein n=1 Tax=Edwardsiella tarda TaxID=636 RepID=UPI00351C3C72